MYWRTAYTAESRRLRAACPARTDFCPGNFLVLDDAFRLCHSFPERFCFLLDVIQRGSLYQIGEQDCWIVLCLICDRSAKVGVYVGFTCNKFFRLWIGRTSFPSPTGLTFSLPAGLAFYCVCEKITCRFSPESWRIAAFALVHSILVRKRGIAGRVHVNVRKVRVNVAWRTWWFVCLLWCTWLPIRTKSTLISSESTAK